ncbi:NAD(P)H-hydrate dehydratase [Gordonia sp. NPDC058843]|uniref:NAD(P)H-hydrate dehydratase n=1 Tax=Gordonia sp. NPDC058843 TaxID=3346648 RepID=UPI003681AE33
MPIRYLTADEVRAAERATGDLLTGGTLMQRAAHGVARVIVAELTRTGGCYGRSVGLVVGAGDNGGDALFAGAELCRRGVRVDAVLLAPERTHAAGLSAFRAAGGRTGERLPGEPDVIVDGVVGLGGRGPLRRNAAEIFAAVGSATTVVAVDLPSGVDADTGEVHDPAVRADVTVTFGVRRRAHLLAAPQCGRVVLVDIGLDGVPTQPDGAGGPTLGSLTDDEIDWPTPGPEDDKYTQGVVGVIAGSHRYPGAAVLAAGAAVTATSGMTRFVGSAHAEVVAQWPEVVATPDLADAGRVQAWVLGPGMGTDDAAAATLRTVLQTDLPVLVDADALTLVARDPGLVAGRTSPTLLTPHAGEFARLTGADLDTDRLTAVAGLAERWGVTVLLKGRITLVADPTGHVLGNDAGSSWAATAGAGDVLAGVAGALLAAGRSPQIAGATAARVHARAAELASRGAPIGASALLSALRPAIREFTTRPARTRAGTAPSAR